MALEMAWDEGGFACLDAYARICGVNVMPGVGTAAVQLWIYQNKAARDAGKPPMFSHSYSAVGQEFLDLFDTPVLNIVSTNSISQGYKWLKKEHTQPEGMPPGGEMPDFGKAKDV